MPEAASDLEDIKVARPQPADTSGGSSLDSSRAVKAMGTRAGGDVSQARRSGGTCCH